MRRLLAVAANLVFIFGVFLTTHAQETLTLEGFTYTTDNVIAAYEAGQFRTIETNGIGLAASADGAYISSGGAGIYRVSDGAVMGQFDNAVFSPNGAYFAEDGDGVYRLSDLQRVIAIEPMRYEFTYGSLDTEIEIIRLITGRVTFSDDSQYVAVTGAGVYRLSDGQKIVDTSGYPLLHSGVFDMEFSPDNSMVATGFGIYRLSDGQMLGSSLGSLPHFSADSAYVWLSYVYRLSDGVRLFEVNSPHFVNFSPNMQYAAVLRNGVFQLSDGQRLYALPEFSPEFSHAVFSADSQYMITPDGVYVVATGEKIFNDESTFGMDALFTPDGSHLAIGQDGLYRLSDRVQLFAIGGGAELFNFDGTYLVSDGVYRTADGQRIIEAGGLATFSPDGQYVAMSGEGLYRLSDGQQMFAIDGAVMSFTDDGAYINVNHYSVPDDVPPAIDSSVYRVLDGQRFPGLRILNLSTGLLAVGNSALVIDPTQ